MVTVKFCFVLNNFASSATAFNNEIFFHHLVHSCPEGWITSPNGCFLFAIDVEPKTWFEAVHYCEELGGYLAEILNDETQRFLVEIATALFRSTNWWLGATDQELVSFSILVSWITDNEFFYIKFLSNLKKLTNKLIPFLFWTLK